MLHILLVDDSITDALMVLDACRSSPIETDLMIAYDGEQALKFLAEKNFKPDLILQDLNIPKLDGFSLLERYRGKDGPPVIVFSDSKSDADKQRALALGAREYLIKPTTLHPFITSIHKLVERWSKEPPASKRAPQKRSGTNGHASPVRH